MINPIPQDEQDYIFPLHRGAGICELGNKKNSLGVYKHYFQSLGIEHISIDWNGEDGALPLDLRQPQWEALGEFDMITNIGTTEHVSEQYPVWENIHHLCRVGGIIVSITPYAGGNDWWWHGNWYPTESFFHEFAKHNGYEIEKIGIGRETPNRNQCVRLRKLRDKPFFMPARETMYHNTIKPR